MLVGIALIACGALGMITVTQIGPLELSVADSERVDVPVWAGVGAILAGGILLLVTRKS